MPRPLFPGAKGDDVRQWQEFLRKRGYVVNVDGVYGPATKAAVLHLQRAHSLLADGVVGPETAALARAGNPFGGAAGAVVGGLVKAGKAAWLVLGGLGVLAFSRRAQAAKPAAGWGSSPGPVSPLRSMRTRWFDYIGPQERDARFGPLVAVPAPTMGNPEAVDIRNDFANRVIVARYPQLAGVPGAHGGSIQIHEAAADSLSEVLEEIEGRDLLPLIKSFSGSWVPRFVRGSRETLSAHAYGTAIDINAEDNPQGSPPTASQTELARVFAEHGWFWGDWFTNKRDPMHFEFIGSIAHQPAA